MLRFHHFFFTLSLPVCLFAADWQDLPNSIDSIKVVLTARTPSSTSLVMWDSEESQLRIARADKTNFFNLTNQYEGQINKFYCGVASAVIVMNALRIRNGKIDKPTNLSLYIGPKEHLPKNPDFVPVFARYSQDSFFNSKTDKIKTRNQVFGEPNKEGKVDFGIQLGELGGLLQAHQLKTKITVVRDDLPNDEIRKSLLTEIKTKNHFVIVNFHRKFLGQEGGGHISPLAAYDKISDSVLIMDVNPTFQQWIWVGVDDLIRSMRTLDESSKRNRGYIVVSEGLGEI